MDGIKDVISGAVARLTCLDPWRLERILGGKEEDTMVFAARERRVGGTSLQHMG